MSPFDTGNDSLETFSQSLHLTEETEAYKNLQDSFTKFGLLCDDCFIYYITL